MNQIDSGKVALLVASALPKVAATIAKLNDREPFRQIKECLFDRCD